MRQSFIGLLLGLGLAGLNACGPDQIFDDVPEIAFVSLSKDTIREFEPFQLTIRYQDGDGDLGVEGNTARPNLFLQDDRDIPANFPSAENPYDGIWAYSLPSLTPDARRPSIQGEITLTFDGLLGMIDPRKPSETVRFKIYMVDRAGNRSNVVVADPLVIVPE
jgi:hypothetical protein